MHELRDKPVRCRAWLAVACLVLVTLAWGGGTALAHKVNVFAYLEGGRIKGEGYFAGGDKAQASLVEVLDGQGKLAATTHTDREGQFSLDLPAGAVGPLRVVLKAGQGHQGEYTLREEELRGAPPSPPKAQTPSAPSNPVSTPASGAAQAPGELEERLGRLLEQRLQPLTAQVAKLGADRGVGLTDVLGGLGYILGLMGLAAYLKSRRKG